MVRIPIGNHRSARVEVRSIAPDASPYLSIYALLRAGLEGPEPADVSVREGRETLPDNVYDAIDNFRANPFLREILGAEVHERYAELKLAAAQRCPRLLGTLIKRAEVQFHHEVTNQQLWTKF